MTGIELIAKERQEQIEKHGFNSSHDSEYLSGELITAAEFALHPMTKDQPWPFRENAFKSRIQAKNKIDRLIIAGAFIAAEIDRLKNQ